MPSKPTIFTDKLGRRLILHPTRLQQPPLVDCEDSFVWAALRKDIRDAYRTGSTRIRIYQVYGNRRTKYSLIVNFGKTTHRIGCSSFTKETFDALIRAINRKATKKQRAAKAGA